MRKAYLILVSLSLLSTHAISKNNKNTKQEKQRQSIVMQAKKWLGTKKSYFLVKGKKYRFDCSGFVRACYAKAGISITPYLKANPAVRDLALRLNKNLKNKAWRQKGKQPRPGDFIFFNNTYDRNRNRKWDDPITHVALVEKVERDGTIHYLHVSSKGVTRYMMNLKHPTVASKDGKKINSYLRRRPKHDNNRGRYTSGSLFDSFGSIL